MKPLILAALFACAAQVGHAATVTTTTSLTQSFSVLDEEFFGPGGGTGVVTIGSDTSSVQFQNFNAALGTLNSVSVALGYSGTLEARLLDFGSGDGYGSVDTTLRLGSLTAGGNFEEVLVACGIGAAPACSSTGQPTVESLFVQASDAVTFSGSVWNAQFQGAATGVFSAITNLEAFVNSGESVEAVLSGYTLSATITYDYTPTAAPVPLPASGLLMLGGVAALAARRAKRR
ncbi:MAG: hypothetical protein AAF092_04330 [Pseudomonadota bacterium]